MLGVGECTVGKTEQERRIERAVAEAVKKRDRYAEDRVEELMGALEGAADDVAGQIRRFDAKAGLKPWQEMRLALLKELEKELEEVARELEREWVVGVRTNVDGAMKLGIEDGVGQMEALGAEGLQDLSDVARSGIVRRTFAAIDRTAVAFLANYQVQLLGDVSGALVSGIKRVVTQGVLSGRSMAEVAREVGKVVRDREAFRRAGKTVFKTAQRRAMLIARTETMRAHNEGRMAFYREVAVARVTWIAADDGRVCAECGANQGKHFNVGELPPLPLHPGCRCSSAAQVR